jgi:hypothetical protein
MKPKMTNEYDSVADKDFNADVKQYEQTKKEVIDDE